MINPLQNRLALPERFTWPSVAAAACLMVALLPAGCSEEPPPPPPITVKPSAPAVPPPPRVRSVEDLMAELGIDKRIVMEESKAPGNTEARVAVLEFFDAMASGDTAALGKMLSAADRDVLELVSKDANWASSVAGIRRIEIQCGNSPKTDDPAALAVIEVDANGTTQYQPQLWYYNASDSGFSFIAVATPPGVMDKLSGEDWIASWHKLLDEDLAMAEEADKVFEEPKKNLDNSEGSSSSGEGISTRGAGMPGRRAPPRTPYQPPRP